MEINPYESPAEVDLSHTPTVRRNGLMRCMLGLLVAGGAMATIDMVGTDLLPRLDSQRLRIVYGLGWALVPLVIGSIAYAVIGFTDWAMSIRKPR